MSGTPCLSGFWLLCYPIIPMYVRARHGLRCGRVRDACGVCQKMGHHSKRGSDGVGVVYVSY